MASIQLPGMGLSVASFTLSGALVAGSIQDTGLAAGVVHSDASGNFTSSTVVNADVDAAAAIAGTKVSPDFGAQAITTTGSVTGAGVMQAVEFAVAHAATVDSSTSLPATAHVYKVRLKIGTQYSAGATLDVGQAGHTTDFVNHAAAGADPALSDLSLLAVGDVIDVDGITAVAGAGAVRVSIGGAPAAGAGTLLVMYASPMS